MKRISWLKIFGIAILIHVILIALSFLEVFIYSTLINPGQTKVFYEGHATKTAPYVATIAGFILMYLFVVRLSRKKETNPFLIGLALPIIYIVIDFILLAVTIPDWTKQLNIPLISNFIKFLAGIIAAYRVKTAKN
jgi:hypothetical protein